MKNFINPNELVKDQFKHLHAAILHGQYALEKNMARANTPELKTIPENFVKPFGEYERKQEKSKLHIKNMVSIRCKMIVKAELEKLGLQHGAVDLGEVNVIGIMTDAQREKLKIALLKYGLELMEDHRAILVEKIKNVIVEMIHYEDELLKVKHSVYIKEKLNHSYTYLSNLFTETTGTSIEHYILLHKIEKVKEFIIYGELNLTEIAYQLHYSSVAHLSNQFKKITGLTPSFYKHLKHKKRTVLEKL